LKERVKSEVVSKYLSLFDFMFSMEFRELSEWELIRSFLPSRPARKPMVDDRSLINSILYVATTGCLWRDMPSK